MTTDQEPVAVPQLHPGDTIHISEHQVFRHTQFIHTVACKDADVLVDSLVPVETVIVICWHCGGACGAVVYDADDSVLRVEAAAAA